MLRRLLLASAVAIAPPVARPALAQTPAEHIAAGDRAYTELHAVDALAQYEAALQADSSNAEAAWKASRSAADLAEAESNDDKKTRLFGRAIELGEHAVRLKPSDAETHFNLARALGLKALSVSVFERTKYGVAVHDHAKQALDLDPKHPGALHILGEWNAQIMRLNGMQRFMAKNVMGGRVFGEANWDGAQSYLERSVALDPDRLTHHLALAKVYLDRDQKAKAREQLTIVSSGRVQDYNDPNYKREADKLLKKLD